MPRSRAVVQLPPPLPPTLAPARARPQSLTDAVDRAVTALYADETDMGAKFRAVIGTVDAVDSVTGKRVFDECVAAQLIKAWGASNGDQELNNANLAQIASKIQWALRRHNTPEIAYSRNERLRRLAAPSSMPVLDASEASNDDE